MIDQDWKWQHFKYDDGSGDYWRCGIYKICYYDYRSDGRIKKPTYRVYKIGRDNWGDYVNCMNRLQDTLEEAKQVAYDHAKGYVPTSREHHAANKAWERFLIWPTLTTEQRKNYAKTS